MQSFNVEIKRSKGSSEPLPAGGYVAKIMNAEVINYSWGEQLVLSFDVSEGEHKGFFAEQYKANQSEDKRWKGNFRLTVPDEKNQYFESQLRAFGNAIACIEESNGGYHWDWNESGLKGKTIGVLFRNKEWEYNGSTGWTTECCTVVSADEIRSKKFKMPKDKPLKNRSAQQTQSAAAVFDEVLDDDLPF